MCGINGILYFRKQDADEQVLTKMRDALAHRGPDDCGIFIDGNLGLGHRRLSILDTSAAGHQPFLSDDGRYAMVFNGEIYNFREFHSELKAAGCALKTQSDTEVLMKLFQLHGTKMLQRLNGMFAFAIWDKLERKLTLVRDRMGVKPLYYAFYNDAIFFASEQKAIFAAGVPLQIAAEGLQEYIFNRFVAGENTLFEKVKKLLPGHIMTISENGKTETSQWWNLKKEIQEQPKIKNPQQWFSETFDESVKLRMVSDVPVGVLLSGGLDSSSVLASLKHQDYEDINTFNIGFSESEHNESHLAKMLSEKFDYKFESIELKGETLFKKMVAAAYYHDEPLMHLSEPHLLAVSELAKPSVKVLLSGEGADELMGGYVRYKPLRFPSLLQSMGAISSMGIFSKNARFDKLSRYAQIKSQSGLVIYNGSNIYPKDIEQVFRISDEPANEYRHKIFEDARSLYPGNLKRQMLYFDQHTYLCSLLDRNDRCTMGASIECREPYLDQRLVKGLGSLDDKWLFTGKKGKYILKSSVENRLPEEILNFRKIGLSAPWGDYLIKNPAFAEEVESFIKSDIFRMPYLEHIDAEKLVCQLRKGERQMVSYVMPLFMLHIWLKYYVKSFSAAADMI
ncbi:asparagine synthase (glutamine-hydrolyzing) [Flavobacterium pallidum]|uniref:asparagine synthase (glutamine-hydrolyzing) n=1 Tax=Flavobacterium pallidum TaxID=2172098 RepID=A0A2S1SHJ7_9FLAO|nr:asparagine synthase (glutamine-hydrolyzing) [Flavobacterium pallidum]AWI25839.1 asparagine synthase (glutamine-hydrolyzing) [Flavobacterium pallidum]